MFKDDINDKCIEEIVMTCEPKTGNSLVQTIHNSFENRIDYIVEKLKFYFENQEFETIIKFLEENFPEFLKTKIEIHYTILLFQLLDLIIKEEDFQIIEKFFQFRLQEQNYKKKFESVRMIIDNYMYFRNREFTKKFQEYSLFFSFLKIELQNYINNRDDLIAYHSTLDDEICKQIKLLQNESLLNIEEDQKIENDNVQNFVKFIDQSNHNKLISPINYLYTKLDSFQLPVKKKVDSGNKINYVIQDLLEAKANSSIQTESTILTKDKGNKKEKKNNPTENKFLKEFTQKFIKRETIDKKILRSFRKYLKKESSKILKKLEFKKFWIIFTKENILPPMKLINYEMKINVEFKSFSIKYMTWLFSQLEAEKLYMEFVEKNSDKIFKNLIETINTDIKIEKDYMKFLKNLQFYIINLPTIYNCSQTLITAPTTAICPIPPSDDILLNEFYKTDEDNFLNVYRMRSKNRPNDDGVNHEEELLLNDLYFQNSFGDLNVSKDTFDENCHENINDNILNEE